MNVYRYLVLVGLTITWVRLVAMSRCNGVLDRL